MKQVQRSCKHRAPRQSWILDSTPCISDSKYWIPDSLSVELGFRISIVSGPFRIPWAVFRIPKPRILESGIPYMGRKSSCNEIGQLYFLFFSHSGIFRLIYVNEYNMAVQAFVLQGTVSDQSQWMQAIKKAQVWSTLSLQVPIVTKVNFPLTISIRT